MGRNVKIPKQHWCLQEGCKFTAPNRTELRKHYQLQHDLKEQIKASLIETGWDLRNE